MVRCHRGAIGGLRPTVMLRRSWKIWSATYRTKLDSLGGQASNRNQIPAYSTGVPRRPAGACGATCCPPLDEPEAGALPHDPGCRIGLLAPEKS